jgi:predicted GNAT family acetyltransferase
VLDTRRGELRVLGPADLGTVTTLLERDPVRNVVVDYRARLTRLDPRWMGGEMWGYYEEGRLASVCHAAANLIPAMTTSHALAHFAERALARGPRCSAIVGDSRDVEALWSDLEPHWPAPREIRADQPHLEIADQPLVTPDPAVRRTARDEVEILYPASVAMHEEEVGVSPEAHGGGAAFRAGVQQAVAAGRSYSRIEDGRVVFKADLAAVTPHACQVQGVWVDPERRGEGIGTAGMAAVVELALRDVAPVVSLYANAYNVSALRTYEKVGFRRTATFSTILF